MTILKGSSIPGNPLSASRASEAIDLDATAVPRRPVFVDGGGNNGCSARKFRQEYDRQCQFHIYTFEPNPIYGQCYRDIPRHTLIPAALHDQDGFQPFFLDRDDGDGSTLLRHKLTCENGGFGTLDTESPMKVKTVDLSHWIANELSTDFLLLKLDVEGAEYDILEKMLADGTVGRVRHLFIEWHWWKVGIPRQRHEAMVHALAEFGIPVSEWDALGY